MPYFDVLANTSKEELLAIDSRTASATGSGVDISAYDGNIGVFLNAKDLTAGTLDVKLQHSADNSTYADIPNGAFTQITTTNCGLKQLIINTQKIGKYIKAVSTQSDEDAAIYAVWMIGRKQYS